MMPREKQNGSDTSRALQATMNVSVRSFSRSVSASVQVREFAEERKALVNLLRIELLQAIRSEALHRKRAHHSTVEPRLLERRRRQILLRRQVPEETARERIPRARRI